MTDGRRDRRWAATPLCPRSALGALFVVVSVLAAALGAAAPSGAAATEARGGTSAVPLRSVGIVGDSIAYQSRSAIVSVLRAQGRPLAHLDVRNAATIDDIRANTIAAATARDGPDSLVLVLGTAQANVFGPFESTVVGRKWENDLRGLLRATAPHVGCIRVFDIQERKTGFYVGVDRHAAEMNGATRRVVAEFANVEYFHYRSWTDLVGRRYDWGDGLHYDNAGRRAVARLVRDAANGCDPATASSSFWDIGPNHWAVDEIAWMVAQGLASGFDNGSFRAEIGEFSIPVTRGQAINMLWRQAGRPVGAAAHGWSDGPAWLEGALDWAWSDGVASGWPDGTFRPDGSITRAELARMLWERAGSPVAPAPHTWVDGAPWVDEALDWIATTGLMTGWPGGTFKPGQPITRAQVARVVFRFDALPPPAPAPPAAPPGDALPSTPVPDPTVTTTTMATAPTALTPNTTAPGSPTTSIPARATHRADG